MEKCKPSAPVCFTAEAGEGWWEPVVFVELTISVGICGPPGLRVPVGIYVFSYGSRCYFFEKI
eukprot:5532157-Karenia_brevis.AAC.2